MSDITTAHRRFLYGKRADGLPHGAVVTHHFTRTDMAHEFAKAMRFPCPRPMTRTVYESEQVVIVEYQYNDEV